MIIEYSLLPSHLDCISDTADYKHELKAEFFRQMFNQFFFLNYYFFTVLALLSDFIQQCYTNFVCIVLYCIVLLVPADLAMFLVFVNSDC